MADETCTLMAAETSRPHQQSSHTIVHPHTIAASNSSIIFQFELIIPASRSCVGERRQNSRSVFVLVME